MHFAMDIDQTICGSNAHEVYAPFHNNDLHLGIDECTLRQLGSYADFVQLPQVRTFYKHHPQDWKASRRRAIANPDVLLSFKPIDGAKDGVETISQYGTIAYYTARTPEVKEVTQSWLAHYGFFNSQEVICCSSIEQKLLILAQHSPQDEELVLVDDRGHTHVLSALEQMKEDPLIHDLLKRLTIVSFGVVHSALAPCSLCPMFALPSWQDLARSPLLLPQL